MRKTKCILFICTSLCLSASNLAAMPEGNHPFYVGGLGGYGTTTWGYLVPSSKKRGPAMVLSTPKRVTEAGAIWGLLVGYEFNPTFAVEGGYIRYPNAKVTFYPNSLFTVNHAARDLSTHADVLSLMAKLMVPIYDTKVKAYSTVGIGVIHRWDAINDHRRGTPNFGVGINYHFNAHFMGEIAANFTPGYGEAELQPAEDYVPFLYSGQIRIAYRI